MLFYKEVSQLTQAKMPLRDGLTVLIADEHHLVRGGLKLSLQEVAQDVEVLEAETLAAAVETFRTFPGIDLVVLDLGMAGPQGAGALEAFATACPNARIVVVSATCEMHSVQQSLRQGALGFIPKAACRATFINALRFVLDGGTYIPAEAVLSGATASLPLPPAAPALTHRAAPPQPLVARVASPPTARLTARQIDVLVQLLDGKPNKQICRELNLSLGTVKCHVGAILGALEVNNRAEAIAAANKRGWHEWIARSQAGTPASRCAA